MIKDKSKRISLIFYWFNLTYQFLPPHRFFQHFLYHFGQLYIAIEPPFKAIQLFIKKPIYQNGYPKNPTKVELFKFTKKSPSN
ncbi:MAG: hypothetical protein CVT99_10450 [Bacteroidetes bacterium HGW-Bacteroidetes-16]|nr:MAG: hypothetical protein CVT99_10450 [Bacteroidetes bacterium HGW-Bacteroidetes-16]